MGRRTRYEVQIFVSYLLDGLKSLLLCQRGSMNSREELGSGSASHHHSPKATLCWEGSTLESCCCCCGIFVFFLPEGGMKSSHLAEAAALTDERTAPPAIFRRMFIFSPAGLRQHLSSRPLYRSCDPDLSLLHLRFLLPILSVFPPHHLPTIHSPSLFLAPGHLTPCSPNT